MTTASSSPCRSGEGVSTTQVLCSTIDVERLWARVGELEFQVFSETDPNQPYRAAAGMPRVPDSGESERIFLEAACDRPIGLIHRPVRRRHTATTEWYIKQRTGSPHIVIDVARLGTVESFGLVRVHIMRWERYWDHTLQEDYKPPRRFFELYDDLARCMKRGARRHRFENGFFWVTADARAVLDSSGWPTNC